MHKTPAIPALPNFFLAGAPKAGTTALYVYLGQHPRIYTTPIQAPSYFADEVRPEFLGETLRRDFERNSRALKTWLAGPSERRFSSIVLDWDEYLGLFRAARDEPAIGETSPIYLWSKSAARNIAAKIPGARILLILRNPADRAFSEYLNYLTVGAVRHSFGEQLQSALRYQGLKMGPEYPFLEFGLYCEQVKRFFQFFPRDRVHIIFYEDYQSRQRQSVEGALEFLGVDPKAPIDLSRRHNQPRVPRLRGAGYHLKRLGIWHRARRLLPQPVVKLLRPLALAGRGSLTMERKDRELLIDYYREDIGKLATLLNRDLSNWLK